MRGSLVATGRLLLFLGIISSSCSSNCLIDPIEPPQEALEEASSGFQEGDPLPNAWWTIFNDTQLTGWIEQALDQNPTLQMAAEQIRAASLVADRVKSALYPYIWLGADVSRQKLSTTGVLPFKSGPNTPVISAPTTPAIPEYFTLYETELNLTYEFDFWNKNRNRFRAALSEMQAKQADFDLASLELSVAIAETYFDLQIDYARKEIAERFVRNREAFLDLVKERVAGHIDTEITEESAASDLTDARKIVLEAEGEIAVLQYKLLAYLAGNFKEEILPIEVQPIPIIAVPENLPLHLIANRPDIASQLWLIRSADRQIEIAEAEFYPDFNLSAFLGFQTIHFTELFKWPASVFFNVDPAMTLPIFDAGKRMANLRESEVNYNLAVLKYNELVINAAKEVLTALAVLQNQTLRLEENEKKLNQQQTLDRLTSLKLEHSLANGLDELISEANVLKAEDQWVVAKGRVIRALLELIYSLGGGYDCPI